MEVLPGLQRAVRRYLTLRGVRSTITQVAGYDLHHYALDGVGKGPPVVLVHGLAGSANGFHKVLFGLSQRFSRVLAPDLPGNGFSPLAAGAKGLGARRQLEVLSAFLEQEARAPAFLVGNSLGGAMAVTLAQHRPEAVRALGLVAPAGARVAEARLLELHRVLSLKGAADARALTRRLFHRTPLTTLLLADDLYRMYDTPSVRAVLGEFTPHDCLEPDALRCIRAPTVLVWGKSEKLLPYEGVNYFREHLPPHAEVHLVEGFGHIPQMERPAQLVRLLTGFADRAGL
jgi:pimeloyl-ACP methyl ester carboxylesterase